MSELPLFVDGRTQLFAVDAAHAAGALHWPVPLQVPPPVHDVPLGAYRQAPVELQLPVVPHPPASVHELEQQNPPPQSRLKHWLFALQAKPAGFCVGAQLPFEHVWLTGQTLRQLPQWLLSLCVLTQALPHNVCPPGQATHCPAWQLLLAQFEFEVQAVPTAQFEVQAEQAPLVHTVPLAQALPQAPQLLLSVLVLVHVPLQLVVPPGHVAHTPPVQTPLWQVAAVVQADPTWPEHAPPAQAKPLAQVVPQSPQFDGSVLRVSQNKPHLVPVQVSVSPAAFILYSTSRFASAPSYVPAWPTPNGPCGAQVEPVRRIDWRVAPAAKVNTMGPVSDQYAPGVRTRSWPLVPSVKRNTAAGHPEGVGVLAVTAIRRTVIG